MGFFKSLFSSNTDETDAQSLEQEAAEKHRVAFETLCDNGVRAMNIKEYKLTTDYLSKAVELEPDDEKARSFLAEAYMNSGEAAKAMPLLRQMVEKYPESVTLQLSLAQVAAQTREWETMLYAATSAEEADSDNPAAHFLKGVAFHGMEDEEKAVESFTKAITLDPDYNAAYIMRARALAASEKFDEAENDIDIVIKKNEADDDVFIRKGELREGQNDYTGAIKAYDDAIEANPFNRDAYIKKATAEEAAGNDKKAMEVLNDGIKTVPDFQEALQMRARLRQKLGDEAGAAQDIEQSESIKPQKPEETKEMFTEMQNRIENNMQNANPLGI